MSRDYKKLRKKNNFWLYSPKKVSLEIFFFRFFYDLFKEVCVSAIWATMKISQDGYGMPSHHLLMMRQFITQPKGCEEEFLQLSYADVYQFTSFWHAEKFFEFFSSITFLIVCTEFNDTLFENEKLLLHFFYLSHCVTFVVRCLKDSSLSSGFIKFVQL
jgi:hypothetical protein